MSDIKNIEATEVQKEYNILKEYGKEAKRSENVFRKGYNTCSNL